MAQSDELLTTIEAVHQASLDSEEWPAALSGLAGLFGGSAATLESYDVRTGGLLWLHAFGIPPANQLAYFEHYAALNPRAAFGMRHPSHEVLWDYQVLDETQMDRDPYYTELLPQTGFRYFVSGVVGRSPEAVTVATIQRSVAQGHVGDGEVGLMRRLLPHLRQAVDVSRRLGDVRRNATALRAALDLLADGVALVGAAGELIFANAALRDMAQRARGLQLRHDALEFTTPRDNEALAHALAEIARRRSGGGEARQGTDFAVERGGGLLPLIVAVRPLAPSERLADVRLEAGAVVFVRDPARDTAASTTLLRSAFGLTAAEAELALALRARQSLAAYARERSVSLNTAYTHLRRVKEKLGGGRLTELISILDRLGGPMR